MAVKVHIYREPFDPATIPDEVIVSEYKGRREAKKKRLGKQFGAGALKVVERTCKGCQKTGSTRWLRTHSCTIAWPQRY